MANQPLVSIIMAVYNMENYIFKAISSVINQNYWSWELIVVNDGSIDNTEQKILEFNDPRIIYIKTLQNKGTSHARNQALAVIKGEYFCFLDADDYLSTHSIASRISVFQSNDNINFVDGQIGIFNSNTETIVDTFKPVLYGNPLPSLLKIKNDCFFSLTWMIKKKEGMVYMFKESLTHGEDLLFFINIAHQGIYAFADTITYYYRTGAYSAMSNLKGLEMGYLTILKEIKNSKIATSNQVIYFKIKATKIMFLSYLKRKKFLSALNVLFKYISA